MNSYTLHLPYPISTNKYWRAAYNSKRILLSEDGARFKKYVQRTFGYLYKPNKKDVHLSISICPKLTKKNAPYAKIIDLDNCCKCVLDSLIGIAYIDDKQVKELNLTYGEATTNGCTIVTISDYNFFKGNQNAN